MSRDDFSNFKSAIEWKDIEAEPSEGADDGGFRPIGHGLAQAIDNAAHAYALAPDTESPIEVQFGGYLAGTLNRDLQKVGLSFRIGELCATEQPTVFLTPQYVVGPYRYDFAVIVAGRPAVLIECDGKEFHESDEAKARDRLKDEKAISVGAIMLRFTGSEIYRDLKLCVDTTIQAILRWRP